MRHIRFGRAGLRVSRLCFRTMTFGLQCDEPTSVAILERAAAGGITFLAVAWVLAHPAATGASRPEQLDDVLPAAEAGLPADLTARLDELTREYRRGDDPR